jgi:Na+/melibiose symporter-like transporter
MDAALDPPRRFTPLQHFYISCLWFAYNVQWGALLAVVLPDQIRAIAGDAQKEFFLGLIGPLGAVVALILAPAAGALSDRSRHPWGKRRPFLLAGVVLNIVFLLLMAPFGAGGNIWLYTAIFLGVQFGCNLWGGPYAGLIPDIVPEEQRGEASAWMAAMTAAGTLVGALAAGFIKGAGYWPIYGMISVTLAVAVALTMHGVRETPLKQAPPPFELGAFLRSFVIDPKEHRDFYWVLITRALVTMGIYSVFTFFQYFLGDVIRVADPAGSTSILIGIITFFSIPTSLVAGPLSDRRGRKPMVYLSGGIMAVVSAIFIAVTFFPSIQFMWTLAVFFGLGYGAYQAVDWALAVDVLPAGEDAAKDMGIWHVAIVLPQILAPFITGMTLSAFKGQSLLAGYTVVFALTAVWFVLGTVFVRQIRKAR